MVIVVVLSALYFANEYVLNVGEVHYIRNGHHISTLMHVDTSLPLWALFDIYGTVQKVKLLGSCSASSL